MFRLPSSTPPGKTAKSCSGTCERSLNGLTQAEAEERARTAGPNEVAQERKQGWPIRVLKIIRNPLVILLSILSAISFLTGDARAGSVMAGMVALSVGLRFWQEARADCRRGEAQGHDPRDRHGGSGRRGEGDTTPGPGAGRHHQAGCRAT